jgi:hypothetical protein
MLVFVPDMQMHGHGWMERYRMSMDVNDVIMSPQRQVKIPPLGMTEPFATRIDGFCAHFVV